MQFDEVAHGDFAALLRNKIHGIRENTHMKVLIIGCRGDNFPTEYRQHPQLVFWEGEDGVSKTIPMAVKLVLRTRFLTHMSQMAVKRECDARGIRFVNQPLGTGEIKAIIAPLMTGAFAVKPESPPSTPREEFQQMFPTRVASEPTVSQVPVVVADKETTVMTPAPISAAAEVNTKRRGWLQALVQQQRPDLTVKPLLTEAQRIHDDLLKMGITPGGSSVRTILYQMRQQKEIEEKRRSITAKRLRTRRENESRNGHAKTPVALTPVTKSSVAEEDPGVSATDLMRLIDDAAAALALVREGIEKYGDRRQQLRALLAGL